MIGAVLIALTAWLRLKIPGKAGMDMGGIIAIPDNEEASRPMWVRRLLVIVGGVLLVVGFYFQIHANQLQMMAN